MHGDVARLEAMEFANLVAGLSPPPAVVGVFDKADENGAPAGRVRAGEQLNGFLQTGGARKADIVAIIDSAGKVLARDLNVNAMYGEDLRSKYPAVGAALRGEATKDIWTLAGRMTRVAVAPIVQPDGTLRGALLVGYVLTARDAQVKHDLLGTEIAYFHDGKVHTSSFVSEGTGESAKEDGNKTQALNQVLFQSPEAWGQQALAEGGADGDLPPRRSTDASTRRSRRRCTATRSTRPAAWSRWSRSPTRSSRCRRSASS